MLRGKNIDLLKTGLDELKIPYMYVRADHDYANWYNNLDMDEVKSMHNEVSGVSSIYTMDFGEFIILGVDNSTSPLDAEAIAEYKSVFEAEKPVIMLTHVPINSLVDTSLGDQSREAWNDRNLTWGDDCVYEPDANMQEFLEQIYKEDSLVTEILSGHLHFTWDGYVTDHVHQHVFSPAFRNHVGIVKVVPKE